MGIRIFVLASLCLSPVLYGQGSVTIFGTVTDPSGAAIAGAKVSAINEETAAARETSSGPDGSYVLSRLSIGAYTLKAEAGGFKTFVQEHIQVQVDENRQVNAQLAVGNLTESVTVRGELAQVETRTGALREVVDSARIIELPLNGRNPVQLQYLVPGAGGIQTAGQEQNDSVSINGSRTNANNYTLDGADNHDPYFNTAAVFPTPDALEEFSLQTNAYGADRGRNAGAIMNAVTRSGTNLFHGSLFEFLRNEHLNARNFFANTVPPFKRNQFGGTVGGPIRKDRTFFFASYQHTAERSSPGSVTPTVLSAAERTGNFSELGKALKDPLGGNFPNAIIPSSRQSKPALNFLDAFVPLPNRPQGLFTFASQQTVNDDQVIAKIDHSFGSAHQLSGRLLYSFDDLAQSVGNTLPGFLASIKYKNWSIAGTDTYIFSARLVNVFTFGYNDIRRRQVPIVPGNKSWIDFGAGFSRASSAQSPVGFDTLVDGYFEPMARFPLNHFRKSFQFSDGLNWTVGSHFLKIGGDIRRDYLDLQELFRCDPYVRFRATYTGDAAADLLIGRPTVIEQIAETRNLPRTTELAMYIQDDWKTSRRLTLNLGVRWDPFFPLSDLNGAFAQVHLGRQSTRFPTAPAGVLFAGDPGVPAATIRNYWGNFGPRFGFAYDPAGDGKTSIRGGYGVFYSQIREQANNQVSNDQPFAIRLTLNSPSGGLASPYADSGNPFPFTPPSTPEEKSSYKFLLPLNMIQWDPNFRNAIAQQWNINVQRQFSGTWLATAAYVGSKGNHLFVNSEWNPAIYGAPGATVDARRRLYPTFSTISDQNSDGNSTYHAMQLSLNKRMSAGLTILANYAWSKMIDDGSSDGSQPANPFNRQLEKAVSDFSLPHRFMGSFIWELPALAGTSSLVRHVFGGWEANGIVLLRSGTPFSVTSGRDNSASAVNQDRADLVGNPFLSGGRSKNDWLQRYFNVAAFAQNAPGTFGTAGRNILRGPQQKNVDFGMIKNFHLTERHRIQFRAEAFNLFNRAFFGNPGGNLSSPNVGRITSAGSPRLIQLALKYAF